MIHGALACEGDGVLENKTVKSLLVQAFVNMMKLRFRKSGISLVGESVIIDQALM